jgi:perosamine synthetase
MTEIQAALGLVQLRKLAALTEQRVANARYLSKRLQGVQLPVVVPGRRHVFHQYTVRVANSRDAFQQHLQEQGIGTAIHYPCPIHHQPVYQSLGYRDALPQAEAASRQVLSLPVHPALSRSDLDRIVAAVNGSVGVV